MRVLLEPGVWLADGEGDPPRTTVEDNAKCFECKRTAAKALYEARKYRPFRKAELQEDFLL